MVKSTSHFCRGLNSQHSHNGLQPSVILVPRDPTSFSGLHGYLHTCVCMCASAFTYMHTHSCIFNKFKGRESGVFDLEKARKNAYYKSELRGNCLQALFEKLSRKDSQADPLDFPCLCGVLTVLLQSQAHWFTYLRQSHS